MPEGPECKIIAESLARAVSNRTINKIEILSGRYLKKPPQGLKEIEPSLPLRVIGTGCHGKFIYWICQNEFFIWSTLGMTGFWSREQSKHVRVKISFTDGSSVFYCDQRNFGTIKFVHGKFKMIDKLKSFGPDMLTAPPSPQEFVNCVKKKPKWDLSQVLMDQSIIAGVGNYIKADSLWLARLSPHKKVSDCSDEELSNLCMCINKIMNESYNNNGITTGILPDNSGYTGKRLVYNQKVDPDGNPVIKETTADKRSTWWVPTIQR